MTGGQWATMMRLAVRDAPHGVPHQLVLRVMPDAGLAAKELAVQREVAEAGGPTPVVRMTGPAGGPFRGAWAVMDYAPGAPLLAGLDGLAALGRLPRIAGRLPHLLADTMAGLHRIDPGPVVARVRHAAPAVAFTVQELWAPLRAGAHDSGQAGLAEAITTLAATQPDPSGGVICHGDLHPFNVLTDRHSLTVIDWTGALLAPPEYDLAFTWLLLRHPPLAAPAALRPVIGAAAALLARRFLGRYRAVNPRAETGRLGWYAGLHAARILIELAAWQRDDDPRAQSHPWRLVAPGAAAALARATGVRV
jgi:aminoglycoside phosphotransferase (APT) family kinase protein